MACASSTASRERKAFTSSVNTLIRAARPVSGGHKASWFASPSFASKSLRSCVNARWRASFSAWSGGRRERRGIHRRRSATFASRDFPGPPFPKNPLPAAACNAAICFAPGQVGVQPGGFRRIRRRGFKSASCVFESARFPRRKRRHRSGPAQQDSGRVIATSDFPGPVLLARAVCSAQFLNWPPQGFRRGQGIRFRTPSRHGLVRCFSLRSG